MEQQKSHPYIRFLILILAIAGMVAFFCLFISPESLSLHKQTDEVAVDPALIALREQLASGHTIIHAGGALTDPEGNSHSYTNALETLPLAYEQGNRFIELDFSYTTDNKAVCLHKWADGFYPGQDNEDATEEETGQMTYDEFMAGKIDGLFTPMCLDDVLAFMETHKDMYLITDIKPQENEATGQIQDVLTLCEEIAAKTPELCDRIIVQIYHENEYDPVRELGFSSIIYTLYELTDAEKLDTDEYLSFAKSHPLLAVTFPKKLLKNEDFLKPMLTGDFLMFTHTVDGDKKQKTLDQYGIDGVYTNDITPL
ncbi:MAG: hypothetical protein IK078_07365 [Lachnospiraceae bacterium]|nr:hypothetical protein [Lachnospiraceae bacterium]